MCDSSTAFAPKLRGCVKGLLTEKQSLHVSSLAFGKQTTKFEMLCKDTKSQQFQSFVVETGGLWKRDDKVRRLAARRGCGARAGALWWVRARAAWTISSAGAVLHERKNKVAARQPCLLSIFDNLKHIQFGFFGSWGLFPKKVLESGCGVKPRIYNSRTVGARGGASHFSFFHGRGVGHRPTYLFPQSGRPVPRISVRIILTRWARYATSTF